MKPDYSARKRGMPTMSIEERLKSNMKVNPVSGCWEWTGCKRGGYGHTIVGSRTDGTRHSERAHRLAYITLFAELDALAIKTGVSKSEMIREATMEYVKRRMAEEGD